MIILRAPPETVWLPCLAGHLDVNDDHGAELESRLEMPLSSLSFSSRESTVDDLASTALTLILPERFSDWIDRRQCRIISLSLSLSLSLSRRAKSFSLEGHALAMADEPVPATRRNQSRSVRRAM